MVTLVAAFSYKLAWRIGLSSGLGRRGLLGCYVGSAAVPSAQELVSEQVEPQTYNIKRT